MSFLRPQNSFCAFWLRDSVPFWKGSSFNRLKQEMSQWWCYNKWNMAKKLKWASLLSHRRDIGAISHVQDSEECIHNDFGQSASFPSCQWRKVAPRGSSEHKLVLLWTALSRNPCWWAKAYQSPKSPGFPWKYFLKKNSSICDFL